MTPDFGSGRRDGSDGRDVSDVSDEPGTSSRRAFVLATGVAAGVALAGCLGGDTDGTTGDDTGDGTGVDDETTDDGTAGNETDGDETATETPGEGEAGATTFVVRVENVSTEETLAGGAGAVPLSPGVYAVYEGPSPLFTVGEPDAGLGLEALAEDGTPDALAASLADQAGVRDGGTFATPVDAEEPGPIGPGGAYEFTVAATPDERLTFATMFVASNDLFYAPEAGIPLFDEDGEPFEGEVTDQVLLWDAGTEVNEEPGVGPNQAPNQSGPNTGPAEDGVVVLVDDVDDGYTYPAVADVIVVTVRRREE